MNNISRHVNGYKTIYDLEKWAKSGVGPSLLKRPPAQGLEHLCHTCICGVFTKSPAGRSTLNHFKPGNITFGVGAPD